MSPTPHWAVEADGLVKTYGATPAVAGVDLRVPAGSVLGLLGPNGAGKTTTVRMLATLTRPDGGSARVLGHDVVHAADAVRARISLTGQFASLDEDLTGRDNLRLIARLLGHGAGAARRRAGDLLDVFGLAAAADKQLKTYSGGMRRRLDIAASLVLPPEVLFLDEPTTGLDPRSRNHVWELVRLLAADGTTVVLTTQYLEEADQLADHIVLIDAGRVIAHGTSAELKASVGEGAVHVRVADADRLSDAEDVLATVLQAPVHRDADPRALTARTSDVERVSWALAELARTGIAVSSFSVGQPSLDEVFLALTGHPTRSDADLEVVA